MPFKLVFEILGTKPIVFNFHIDKNIFKIDKKARESSSTGELTSPLFALSSTRKVSCSSSFGLLGVVVS